MLYTYVSKEVFDTLPDARREGLRTEVMLACKAFEGGQKDQAKEICARMERELLPAVRREVVGGLRSEAQRLIAAIDSEHKNKRIAKEDRERIVAMLKRIRTGDLPQKKIKSILQKGSIDVVAIRHFLNYLDGKTFKARTAHFRHADGLATIDSVRSLMERTRDLDVGKRDLDWSKHEKKLNKSAKQALAAGRMGFGILLAIGGISSILIKKDSPLGPIYGLAAAWSMGAFKKSKHFEQMVATKSYKDHYPKLRSTAGTSLGVAFRKNGKKIEKKLLHSVNDEDIDTMIKELKLSTTEAKARFRNMVTSDRKGTREFMMNIRKLSDKDYRELGDILKKTDFRTIARRTGAKPRATPSSSTL